MDVPFKHTEQHRKDIYIYGTIPDIIANGRFESTDLHPLLGRVGTSASRNGCNMDYRRYRIHHKYIFDRVSGRTRCASSRLVRYCNHTCFLDTIHFVIYSDQIERTLLRPTDNDSKRWTRCSSNGTLCSCVSFLARYASIIDPRHRPSRLPYGGFSEVSHPTRPSYSSGRRASSAAHSIVTRPNTAVTAAHVSVTSS